MTDSLLKVVRALPRVHFHLTLAFTHEGLFQAGYRPAGEPGYRIGMDPDPAQALLKALGSPLEAPPVVHDDSDLLGD